MNAFLKIVALVIYIFKTYWKKASIWLLVMGAVFCWFSYRFYYTKLKLGDTWGSLFDPTFTVFGLMIPIILGLLLMNNEWESSLENKLIVHYSIKNKKTNKKEYVISCYNVNLLHGSDMRAIGQQIGQQMGGTQALKFNPSIKPISGGVVKIKNDKNRLQWIKYFEIEFLLNEEPTFIFEAQNSYLIWNLFNEERIVKEYRNRPDIPFHRLKKDRITIEELLSSNQNSAKTFNSLNDGDELKEAERKTIFFSEAMPTLTFGKFSYEKLDIYSFKKFLVEKRDNCSFEHNFKNEILSKAISSEKIDMSFKETIQLKNGSQVVIITLNPNCQYNEKNPLENLEISIFTKIA